MSTPSKRAAGGLEALQELWRSNAANVWTDAGNKPNEPTIRATSWNRAVQATLERAAEALAPHIAAEREMREREVKLVALFARADMEYMDDDTPKSDFAEKLLDVIAEILPFERTK